MTFEDWIAKITENTGVFTVIPDPSTRSVRIHETDGSPDSAIRVEMSEFDFPYFLQLDHNRKFDYNAALAEVLSLFLVLSSYRNDVSEGIKRITNHRVYSLGANENIRAKDRNTYHLVDDAFLPNLELSNAALRRQVSSLPVQASSEKGVGDGALALAKTSLYRAVGYAYKDMEYTSLFPNASNIPARLKSFVLPSSVNLDKPEGNVNIDGDENTLQCLVVFVPAGRERHVSGEIWVEEKSFKRVTFTMPRREWYMSTNLNEGDEVHPSQAQIINQQGENTIHPHAVSIKCVEKNPLYMRTLVRYPLNEARVTSHTGLKGYMSQQEDIGMLITTDEHGNIREIKPDMVCGPSSCKGKVNQIRLAQAAWVAREHLGYPDGTLDTLDVELINSLAGKIEKGWWVYPGDTTGMECYFGYVNVAFTDPSVQYVRGSYMNFPFEMTKLALKEYPVLAERIMEARDPDKMSNVHEILLLQESLEKVGRVPPGVKVMSHMAFNGSGADTHYVGRINSTELLPVANNYLLDKDRGAFVYMMRSGRKIYIPSGKCLSAFESVSSNAQFTYDTVLVQLSRIFNWVQDLGGLERAVKRYMLTTGNRVVLSPELYGVNLKQVTLYDHVKTVSIPTRLYKAAQRKVFGEEESGLGEDTDHDLYAIVVRNPA